ncbi:hypothetical protein TNCV_3761481 [Trichonephila clavipes]|nr:hypothetical protein TNCV_3761481 [Trichonephila clavipes]
MALCGSLESGLPSYVSSSSLDQGSKLRGLLPASTSIKRSGGNFEKESACVIEREISGSFHKFLEESRGPRTLQRGRQYCQMYGKYGRQI